MASAKNDIASANAAIDGKVSLAGDNTMTGSSKYTKYNGINENAWKSAPVIFAAPTNVSEAARAQVAFENTGKNAGVLWLDTDGKLKFTDNYGNRYIINMTK